MKAAVVAEGIATVLPDRADKLDVLSREMYPALAEKVTALKRGTPHPELARLPTRFFSVLTPLPAIGAQCVLHFCARHDGIACHEA